MSIKVLVTGSSGHLGEAVVRLLLDEGVNVLGLDVVPSTIATTTTTTTTTPTNMVGSIVDPNVCHAAMREGITHVIHTASLHKPHVATHSRQDFVDVNITGTLNLLEAAVQAKTVQAFIFTSTTSAFGDALQPNDADDAAAAVWIDEDVRPLPKNIYGVTKLAAEDLCQLYHRLYKLPCIVLKVSRFFAEEDDNPEVRRAFTADNLKVNELLHRRADIYDMATAHRTAMDRAPALGFDKFIITATSPFQPCDREALYTNPQPIIQSYFPNVDQVYDQVQFQLPRSIDRIYRNDYARKKLGWEPKYSFALALECLKQGKPVGSELARQVGIKGYHHNNHNICDTEDGAPYPTQEQDQAPAP